MADYHRWVCDGRPAVVVRGRPGPGIWDHPWVVYRAVVEPEPATKRARGGDSGCPVIPPPPTLDEETMRQLNTDLPPPGAAPQKIDAAACDPEWPMGGREEQECDAQGGGYCGPVDPVDASPLATRPDDALLESLEGDGGSRPCIPPLPAMTVDVLAQLDVVLPPPEAAPPNSAMAGFVGAYSHAFASTKRNATAMHSPLDDGCQASPKRAKIGPVWIGPVESQSHGDIRALARRSCTTTTTTGADRAAPTATPGSAT